jgi:hypothetical protein
MWNPTRLRRLADTPSVHACCEGQIASVVDRLRRLLSVGSARGIGMKSIGGTELVPRVGQTFHHRFQLGAKLAHPVVIKKRGQHTLNIVRADLKLDRIVATTDIGLEGFNTGFDRGIAREPCLGFAQCRFRSGFHPSDEQQA